MRWLDFTFIMPPNLFIHSKCWIGEVMNEKIRQVFWLIWLAMIRVIWNVCNNSVFNNTVKKKYKINHFRLSALIPYIQLRDTHFDGKLFYFILLQEEFF